VALPIIQPIRPIRGRAVPTGTEWAYEPKLDGFRGTLYVEDGRALFRSKTMRTMRRFQELADGLAKSLPVRDAILDGEIIAMSDRGPDFYALFFRRGKPAFAAFDLLWLNGRDMRPVSFWRRKTALQKLLAHSPIGYVDHYDTPELFRIAAEKDLEGIVAKRRSDPYSPETEWVKVKHSGYSQMAGRWELFRQKVERT
jgi:bifunctional non-homologous end joining protein LigD